jgi:hypothetical protein
MSSAQLNRSPAANQIAFIKIYPFPSHCSLLFSPTNPSPSNIPLRTIRHPRTRKNTSPRSKQCPRPPSHPWSPATPMNSICYTVTQRKRHFTHPRTKIGQKNVVLARIVVEESHLLLGVLSNVDIGSWFRSRCGFGGSSGRYGWWGNGDRCCG